MPSILYSPKEVAKILNVSYRMVLDLISLGEIEAFRIGSGKGVFRISEREVNHYLESNKVDAEFWKSHKPPIKKVLDKSAVKVLP